MSVKPGYKQTEVGVIPEDRQVKPLGEIADLQVGYPFKSAWFQIHNGIPLCRGENVGYGHPDWSDTRRLPEEQVASYTAYTLRAGDIVIGMDRTFTKSGSKISLVQASDCPSLLVQRVGRFVPKKVSAEFLWSLLTSTRFQESLQVEQKGMDIPHLSRLETLQDVVSFPPTRAEQQAIAEALGDADALIEALEQLVAKKRQIKQGAMQESLSGKKRLPGFEIEPGYKQTERGIIPKDWDIKFLPDVCRFRGGKAHEQYFSDLGQYICVNSKFISTDGKIRKYSTVNFCSAKRGDILMVMSDLPNGKALAKAYVVDQDDLYAVNQRVCALTPYHDHSKYLFYVLDRTPYFLKFDDGVNQTHLLNPVFQKCPLLVPSIKAEQETIAAILSDMDAEIATLEDKLAKARQIKQGMMQELLTGCIRLVGG